MAESNTGMTLAEAQSEILLAALASGVTHARIDLVHFPIVYYFAPSLDDASIAKWTGALARFADEGAREDRPAHVRFAAATLDNALSHLGALIAEQLLKIGRDLPRDEIFEAYAKYHAGERQYRA